MDSREESKIEYKDVVYTHREGAPMTLDEFLHSKYCKKKGWRYAEFCCDENRKVRIRFEEPEEFSGGEAALVCIEGNTEEKGIIRAEEKNGIFEVDFAQAGGKAFSSTGTYAVYFAIVVEKRYYLFRLKERTEQQEIVPNTSTLVRDDVRYKEPVPVRVEGKQNTAFMAYRGAYTEALSALVDDVAKCGLMSRESYRITTEKMGKPYKYRFSIVMAVYNVEEYIGEAVESVFCQKIGFEKHIQLILVDDGSTDGSGKLCEEFAARYPKNVVVIHKENGGAASARNAGKEYAEGKYVNFMDPDDKISPDVCSKAWDFFEENQDKIDVVAFPIRFFGAISDEYWQNYKFEGGKRVIDLYDEYTVSDMNTAASFIKNSVVKQHEFDGRIPVGEDLKYLLYILMDKMKLGVIDNCWYYYRRREGSLITSSHEKKGYYLDYMRYLVDEVQQFCLKQYGYIPLYVQNTLMMDLQWRLLKKEIPAQSLTAEELEEYKGLLAKAFRNIDEEVILKQRKLSGAHIYQVFQMKYEREPEKLKVYKDILYKCGNTVFKRESQMSTAISSIEWNREYLALRGYSNILGAGPEDEVATYVSIGGILTRCEKGTQAYEKTNFIGHLSHCEPFEIKIPIHEGMFGKRIYLYVTINGYAVARHNLTYEAETPFKNFLKKQYLIRDGLVLRRDGSGLYVEPCETREAQLQMEEAFCAELQALCEGKAKKQGDAENIAKALECRRDYFEPERRKSKKKIWLVSEQLFEAEENGETFGAYLNRRKPKDVDLYVVISENSEYRNKGMRARKCVVCKSGEHLRLQMKADKIISLTPEEEMLHPFEEMYCYLRDLCRYEIVILRQEGAAEKVKDRLNQMLGL